MKQLKCLFLYFSCVLHNMVCAERTR